MSYLVTIRKSPEGYHLLWTTKTVSLSSGPGLSRFFATLAELTSYLRTRTDFSESCEATLSEKLEREGVHVLELNPNPEKR
ncbi:MAG TPA: hypothetical protein VKA07_11380 [Candidatus Sulfotelmatobacter sp.]|nr:hypothetical protein [Candidatus Sulfotelmatobacter sp.]